MNISSYTRSFILDFESLLSASRSRCKTQCFQYNFFFRRALYKKSIYSRHSFHVKSTTYAMVCDACFEMQRSAQTAFCKRARKVGGGDGDGRVGRGCSHERSCLATFCRPRAINSSRAHTPVADTHRAQKFTLKKWQCQIMQIGLNL